MNFEVLMIGQGSGVQDISKLVTSTVDFADNINKSGVCTFSMIRDQETIPQEGCQIRITHEGTNYFTGRMYKVTYTHAPQIKITAYDQLRQLKAEDTYILEDETASSAASRICGDFQLKIGSFEDTGYPITQNFDGKDVLDIISDCLNLSLVKTKNMFYIKDEGGQVVLRNIRSSITDLMIDKESLLFGYSYERSIDDQTYNQIKLIRDNKETGQREIYMTKDSGTIGKWGLLQYYEKVDDSMNPEEIKEKADSLLYLKNRVRQMLEMDVIGEKNIRAGNMVYVNLAEYGISKFLLCTTAKHQFTNTAHTVKATFKLV